MFNGYVAAYFLP